MAAAMEGWQPITMDMADSVPSVQRKRSGAEVEHFLGLQDAAHLDPVSLRRYPARDQVRRLSGLRGRQTTTWCRRQRAAKWYLSTSTSAGTGVGDQVERRQRP